MIFSKQEHAALLSIISELEKTAQTQPEHSATRTAIYRHAAALRYAIKNAVVTRDGRADGHIC